MMLPDFNRLRVFLHVYRAGSVSAAASTLHVTQSAVSQSLAKLEDELGLQLFVRSHRQITPTAASEALFSIVEPFATELERGIGELQRARHELVGVLAIGAPVEFGSQWLPQLLAAFSEAHRGVHFSLRLGHPSEIVPLLEEGRLDLGFADVFDAPRRFAGLDVVDVADEALLLVGAPDYEAAVLGGSRGFNKLSAARFVDYHPTAPAVRSWFRHHFGRVPSRFELTLSVENVQTVVAAVEHGMGFGVVPQHVVERAMADERLVTISTRRRPLTNRISLVRVPARTPSRLEEAFISFVLNQ